MQSLSRAEKIALGIMALPTLLCVLLAGLHLYNETWAQWATKYGWVNIFSGTVHSPVFLVLLLIVFSNVALIMLLGGWWFANRHRPDFPHRLFAWWFTTLLLSAAVYWPSSQQYQSASAFLFGPRPSR